VGSKGSKPRKTHTSTHSQHLPKVGTRSELEYEQHEEREAILDVWGVGNSSAWLKYTVVGFGVLLLVGAILGLLFWIVY
jgi:hypothetical protein